MVPSAYEEPRRKQTVGNLCSEANFPFDFPHSSTISGIQSLVFLRYFLVNFVHFGVLEPKIVRYRELLVLRL